VGIIFSSSSNILQTATLTISGSGFEVPGVNLSGAFGAIKLFDSTEVQLSFNGVSFINLYNIGSSSLNLSCPASPTAFLSGTPGYFPGIEGGTGPLGNVFVDNFVLLEINGTPVTTYLGSFNNGPVGYSAVYQNPNNGLGLASPPGNVCQGTDAFPDTVGGNTYPECFSAAYRSNVGSILGENSDSIANGGLPNGGAAAGIPALDIHTFFAAAEGEGTGPFAIPATISAVDAGGFVASSTFFLVTNCSQSGITSGGSITGVPITGNTGSQTQTFTFDSSPGQDISFTTSDAVAVQQGTYSPTGVVPIVTDIGISQIAFSGLIAGTSAAPAVCLRLTGEKDSQGNQLCKGFLLQCFSPANGTISGDNCDSQTAGLLTRNLYDSAQFASPDGPVNGTNYLYNGGATDACTYFVSVQRHLTNGACAPSSPPGPRPSTLMGAGFLLGGDRWLEQTPPMSGMFSAANCPFTGVLAGDLCPLDTLTLFKGAADSYPGGGVGGRNSVYVPVVNMPLPFTQVTLSGEREDERTLCGEREDERTLCSEREDERTLSGERKDERTLSGERKDERTLSGERENERTSRDANGWVNSASVANAKAKFVSNAATYVESATDPLANRFKPAAPYSLTFGLSPASMPVPDTPYPVAGDVTNLNKFTNPGFEAPMCNIGGTTPMMFRSDSGTHLNNLAEGVYNLHYYATDCALTEELLFNPTAAQLTDPTANWAKFPVLTFGVDTNSPTITTPVVSVSNSEMVTATYSCSDTGSAIVNSGIAQCGPFAQALSGTPLEGPPSVNITDTTFPNALGPHTVTVTAKDAAGNAASSTVSYSVPYAISPLYDQTKAVKSGATIPIKMYLVSPTGTNLSSASIIVHATEFFSMSTGTSDPVVDAGNPNPDMDFRFGSTLGPGGGYIFNLKTTGLGSGNWVIQFTVGSDPTIHTLGFGIK
jgi:hypothetical protein